MKLLDDDFIKFDKQMPIYNFFFPNQGKNITDKSFQEVMINANLNAKSRALYFHIPFCETICSFCPFVRGTFKDNEIIELYTKSLIQEIEIKSRKIDLKSIPIGAIFFGGGTPSVLSPQQILKIGNAIRKHFDLTELKEFSFEIEVKSLTEEKVLALKEIGVTHPRFGLQTFSKKWRELFDLSSSIEQIQFTSEILKRHFKYVTFDILYGMNGQIEEEIIDDLEKATSLGTSNIDIYPIDNIMTQPRLHKKLIEKKMPLTTATRKFSMHILIDNYMRYKGFIPHNGHGYYRINKTDLNTVVSDEYSFIYHEHVYGYSNFDVLGFGVNAISSLYGFTLTNTFRRNDYIKSIMKNQVIPMVVSEHAKELNEAKPIILMLPYHGKCAKKSINFDYIPSDVIKKLDEMIKHKLITENTDQYFLTKLGWHWYVNMMYYLMPKEDQACINSLIIHELKNGKKSLRMDEVLYKITA